MGVASIMELLGQICAHVSALTVRCMCRAYLRTLFISRQSLAPNKVDFDVDGQRKTSKGNSNLSITAQGIMHHVPCIMHHGRNQ